MQDSTFGEILESEKKMVVECNKKYGVYSKNAFDLNSLLQDFVKEVKLEGIIFSAFLSQVKKHHTLALFSIVRLHHIQAMLDLRYTLESGANAAFAIGNKDEKLFLDEDNDKLKKARVDWLNKNYIDGSQVIEKLKKSINKSCAHSNLIYTFQSFSFSEENKKFETPFFDLKEDKHIKIDLWFAGNIAYNLMDLFFGVNKKYKLIKFKSGFVEEMQRLRKENLALRDELASKLPKLEF